MSPRHLIQRYLGNRRIITNARIPSWLANRLHDTEVWHLGRRSVARGVSLGFFLAFIPLPIQMLIAAPLALVLRTNLPVTLAALWISNPITVAPMLLLAYRVGGWVIGADINHDRGHAISESSISGVIASLGEIWLPLCVGCLICGAIAAALGNVVVRWVWRAYLLKQRRRRHRSLS